MSFKEAVLNTTTEARTWNGMKTLESSLSNNVDLFFKAGASRGKDITSNFIAAYNEDKELALRTALWLRDARSGAGERQQFRNILKLLEECYTQDLLDSKLLEKIPELGRWDDLLVFSNVAVANRAFTLIASALRNGNGLAAKWMPRQGVTAARLRNFMGLSPKRYRKLLVGLTNVVETQMCAREWDEINFEHVPSVAMTIYTKAFARRAPANFTAYKTKLVKGEAKVNASAVYPYDVIRSLSRGGDRSVADAQWKALPNYIGDASIIPLVDVSGSMTSPVGGSGNLTCMDVAVSLGLYCSDKNTGAFKDLFLTFSDYSKFVHLEGSLSDKMQQMKRSDWGMSTNLHAAFEQILKVASSHNVKSEDMPKTLLILSDMQFNACCDYDDSAMAMIRRKYKQAGYQVPRIVFWNLNAMGVGVPVRFDEQGTALVSGFSPSIMKSVLAAKDFSPVSVMKETICDSRYDPY